MQLLRRAKINNEKTMAGVQRMETGSMAIEKSCEGMSFVCPSHMPVPTPQAPKVTPREGTSKVAPEAARQAVGGGCQSGWGRLLSVTNAIDAGAFRQGDSGWA